MSSPSSRASETLPPVDSRLVVPGSGYVIDDGRLVAVPPCDEPHGKRHSKLAALLEAHVIETYDVALDMLTRTDETTDIAPDASVYPCDRDPETNGRRLEELAFQVKSTEALAHASRTATQLTARGVRRVFIIDVVKENAFEWSHDLGTWTRLDLASSIVDAVFAVPLPIEAMVRAAKADDAVARALLAKRNPVLVEALERAKAAGAAAGAVRGMLAAVLAVLDARGLTPTGEQRMRILAEGDRERIDRWIASSVTCASVAELLDVR